MAYKNFISKVREMDKRTARWILRHFYITFFQVILLIIFFVWLFNTITAIKLSFNISENDLIAQVQNVQSINLSILVLLVLLNSFWLLYVFSSIKGLNFLLKDINYSINRLRSNYK